MRLNYDYIDRLILAEAARPIVRAHERARDDYFARYFSVTVDNPRDYHLMLNTDRMGLEGSTEIR